MKLRAAPTLAAIAAIGAAGLFVYMRNQKARSAAAAPPLDSLQPMIEQTRAIVEGKPLASWKYKEPEFSTMPINKKLPDGWKLYTASDGNQWTTR